MAVVTPDLPELFEEAFERAGLEMRSGYDLKIIAPFWRIVKLNSKLAGKLTCGIDFIAKRQTEENIVVF